ncbi:hypothetical protein JCM9957A_59000 [Kineosporia succinea]
MAFAGVRAERSVIGRILTKGSVGHGAAVGCGSGTGGARVGWGISITDAPPHPSSPEHGCYGLPVLLLTLENHWCPSGYSAPPAADGAEGSSASEPVSRATKSSILK